MKYAAPYHDTLFRSWNSSVIFGIAVLRMVCRADPGQSLNTQIAWKWHRATHIVQRNQEHAEHERDDQQEQANAARIFVFIVDVGGTAGVLRFVNTRIDLLR